MGPIDRPSRFAYEWDGVNSLYRARALLSNVLSIAQRL